MGDSNGVPPVKLPIRLRILNLADVSAPRMGNSSREDEVCFVLENSLPVSDLRSIALGIRIQGVPSLTGHREGSQFHFNSLSAAQ